MAPLMVYADMCRSRWTSDLQPHELSATAAATAAGVSTKRAVFVVFPTGHCREIYYCLTVWQCVVYCRGPNCPDTSQHHRKSYTGRQ